jgi:NAD(P)-dependent dehydrogenase (short-subunit alcohol dehydrogenase family)
VLRITTEKEVAGVAKVAVVTGGSAGVGRATVREFARQGFDVAVLARGDAGVEGAVSDVERLRRRGLGLELDVADFDAVDAAAERIEHELGPIDVWVNNAMLSVFAPVDEMEPEEYRRVTNVTYLGVVYGTLAALKRMEARNSGTIVQVGSALAYRSIPLQSAYCASKHAIVGFTDSLRCELVHDHSQVSVTVVHLPAVNTPQFDWVRSRLPDRGQPVPPIFQPEVPARAIVYAAQHPRREMLVGYTTYMAVWGQKFIPGLLDVYLGRTGYASQQTGQAEPDDAPDNLRRPLDETVDRGAHGRFDDRATESSPVLELTLHRGFAAAAVAFAAAALLGVGAIAATRRH